MDLVLNNLWNLICHKTQTINQPSSYGNKKLLHTPQSSMAQSAWAVEYTDCIFADE